MMLPFAIAASLLLSASASSGERLAPRIVSVENGGLLFTDNAAGVSGTDAGYSLPLGDATLWLFGDVFFWNLSDPNRTYVGGVSDCALVVPKGKGTKPLKSYRFLVDPKTGLARQVIPLKSGEGDDVRLWPLGGWNDSRRHRAYLYYGLVRVTSEGGPFGFKTVGHGVAVADSSRPLRMEFARIQGPSEGGVFWPSSGPLFGAAVARRPDRADPYLYVFGAEDRSGRRFGKLARVRTDSIGDPDAYSYFNGSPNATRWSERPSDAADIKGLADFPGELSVSYNAYLGGYLAIHNVNLDPKIRLSLAPEPWGPYREIGEVAAPHRALEKTFCYAGKEHPELSEGGGRIIYVTYVDGQRYWLQLLKITLAR